MPAKGVAVNIVIIGAGILGASAAFHLARMGARPTIIDANLDGRATAAGAGIICPWVKNLEDETFYRLYAGGGEYYPDLIAALAEAGETDLGYRQSGAMLVSADPRDLASMERSVRQRNALAMGEVTRLAPSEAQSLFPALADRLGAIHIAGGARVDGRLLTAAMVRAAEKRGATVLQGHATPVIQSGRVIGVDLNGERIVAERLIVTAGAWVNQVLNLSLPIDPQRGQITHLRLDGTDTSTWPVILPQSSHYIVAFDQGRIVAGATREHGSGFDYRVTAAGQAEVLHEALRIAPGLGAATLIETRIGFRPLGTEARPLLGWVKQIGGLVVGNGLGPSGLTMGPFAGRLLAELVAGETTSIDLAAFDPMRRPARAATHQDDMR
jgi:D-amino-acid dehydrogenase